MTSAFLGSAWGGSKAQLSAKNKGPGHGSVSSMDLSARVREQRKTLAFIRNLDASEGLGEEEAMPRMPKACRGFHSGAHLRTEAYWNDLLGQHDLRRGPCKWVEERCFEWLVAIAVVSNAAIVGMDSHGALPWHWWAQQPPLLLGLLEFSARALRWRRGFRPRDNEALAVYMFDAAAVVTTAALLWGQFVVESLQGRVGGGADLAVCVLSLMRLARLVHIVPGLHELARGIMDALTGLFWVLVLTFLVIYATAILCTRLIGHSELEALVEPQETSEPEEVAKVKALFSNVISSIFLLFQVMSAWSLQPLLPLFEVSPAWQLWFSLFYIFAGWVLLAVMTGTVSFTMIAIRARHIGEDRAREEQRREQATEMLLRIFGEFDLDHNGEISHEELMSVLGTDKIQGLLSKHTNIVPKDLAELFSWIDDDKSGSVSFDEFMYGFRWLNDSFKTQNLLRLREKVTKDMKQLLRRMEATVQQSFDSLKSEVEVPVKKLHALSEQVLLAHAHAVETTRVHEAPQAIAELEMRIGAQVDAIVARAEELAGAQGDSRYFAAPLLAEHSQLARLYTIQSAGTLDTGQPSLTHQPSGVSRDEQPAVPIASMKSTLDLGAELSSRGSQGSARVIAGVGSLKSMGSFGSAVSEQSDRAVPAAGPAKPSAASSSSALSKQHSSGAASSSSQSSAASRPSAPARPSDARLGLTSSSLDRRGG